MPEPVSNDDVVSGGEGRAISLPSGEPVPRVRVRSVPTVGEVRPSQLRNLPATTETVTDEDGRFAIPSKTELSIFGLLENFSHGSLVPVAIWVEAVHGSRQALFKAWTEKFTSRGVDLAA